MAAVVPYETDEDPDDYARRVCDWHAANTGQPLTHDEVMIVHLRMADPESRRRCRTKVDLLTKPGGEFASLRETGKFAVNRKSTAERHNLPYRRVRRFAVVNRMKLVDRHRSALAAREHLPAVVKEPFSRILDAVEQNTARYLSIGRAYELLENTREATAATNNEIRMLLQEVIAEREAKTYLQEALLAALGGQRLLPPPTQPEGA